MDPALKSRSTEMNGVHSQRSLRHDGSCWVYLLVGASAVCSNDLSQQHDYFLERVCVFQKYLRSVIQKQAR